MKKFIYLCSMMLLCLDVMAQIGNDRQLDDSLYCSWIKKELYVVLNTNNDSIHPGWRYDSVHSDEFNGNNLDRTKWFVMNKTWHSPKKNIGYFDSNNNVFFNDGKLYLSVTNNDDSIECYCSWDTLYNMYVTPKMLSGWIQSNKKIRYGYIETNCYLPKNHNYWPCLWTTGRYQTSNYDDYDEVDVFERTHNDGTNYPNKIRQNCYNGIGCEYTVSSQATQILTLQDSITGQSYVFGVEILPEEVVFYINGEVTSRLMFTDNHSIVDASNNYTCTDIEEMIAMHLVLSLTCDGNQNTIPLPQEPAWFDYVRCYKLERGSVNTFHPLVYSISNESTKVYPHVILGGTGCTAVVNYPSAVWAEQDIVLDKGFQLSANTPFSARVISVPSPETSELYKQNCN